MNKIEQFSWNEIKHKVKAVKPALYEVIEKVAPPEDIPFFLAHYDFGEHFGIKDHAYLPTETGTLAKIESFSTSNHLYQHLGYGKHSIPLGIILDKYCEWHYLEDNQRVFPDCIQGPGTIFNMQVVFDEDKTVDNNVLSASSGALSSFLLPNIGCKRKHARIQKYFKTSSPAPKSPYEHYLVFQELLKKVSASEVWQSQILYFSETFVNEVKNNDEWIHLKLFFSESLRKKLTQNTYDASCHDLFLSTERVNRFRPTPFIIDTAKYIFNICMGASIGVKPATDEQCFPVKEIQNIYQNCYGLEYIPTVMVPATLETLDESVYYPLQCPFSKINTFKTNQSVSTFAELETLQNVILAYQEEFTNDAGPAFASPLYQVSQNTEFSFYHYKADGSSRIHTTSELIDLDPRFNFSYPNEAQAFASDAKLFRGCVRIRHRTSV